ncbi:hypothetical protein L249_8265 [Ophiocordyceps polyrhachis-furcata BCC 54312]|uniref:Uncharacterized protein n=1 Tax=Ophiocordyceps polyrhachis-furcata BCC 54312 TaxID=1330021 RepID=A0A367LHH3_9HYPO|nr:hypothetical protein L249_8265 [Ophiocordyceps polyrhachis-furcata BCC 54312]
MDSSKQQNKKGEDVTTQPINPDGGSKTVNAFNAQPGPVIPDKMPAQEGTAEDRQARVKTLNK